MAIRSLKLVAFKILRTDDDDVRETWMGDKQAQENELQSYIAGGMIWGGRRIVESRPNLPALWREVVTTTWRGAFWEPEGYWIRLAILELNPASLAVILAMPRQDTTLNALYEVIFADYSAPIVRYMGDRDKVGSVLSVEMNTDRTEEEIERDAVEIGLEWLSLLSQERSAIQPHLIRTTMLFASCFLAPVGVGLTSVTFQNIDSAPRLTWPKVVEDALLFIAYSWIVDDLGRLLSELPFRGSVGGYVQRLENHKTKRAGAEAYEAVFLRDRGATIDRQTVIARILRGIEEAVRGGHIGVDKVGSALRINHASYGLTRGTAIECMRRSYLKSVVSVNEASEFLSTRAAILADYLRDVTTSRATQVNLRIQRILVALTIISSVLGTVGVAANFVPESGKMRVLTVIETGFAWIYHLFR